MTVQPKDDAQNSARRGFFYALAAYCLWGFFPLYFRAVDFVPPAEVLVHRVVWSVPFALAVIAAQGRLNELKALFLNVHILRMMLLTAVLVSVNWIIFIWAISVNLASETALGYYINPLITVLMGFALLGERFSLAQRVAMLRGAERSICVQTFIWADDAAGRFFLTECLAAARRGVEVRLLADAMFRALDGRWVGGARSRPG